MKGIDPHDPRPMLLIFLGVVSVAAWRAVSSIDPGQALHSIANSLAPFALGAIAIASALATQRFLATRRALSERTAAAVIPADEFEADPETVLRFAAELARADRSLGGWFDRSARALRVGLASDKQGRLVYFLTYPARSRELVRAALRGYEGVELRDMSEVLPKWPRADRVKLRTELVLAQPSIEPLARLELDPDPLQPFAAAMASLRPGEGERVWVCVDLLPASARRASRLQRRLKRQAKRRHGEPSRLSRRPRSEDDPSSREENLRECQPKGNTPTS